MNQAEIEAGFRRVQAEHVLRARRAQVTDPGFWRDLNPQLTISAGSMAAGAIGADRVHVEPAILDRAARQLVDDGYLLTPPLVSSTRTDTLRRATQRIVDAGLPAGFLCLYDEFYQAFHGLDELFVPLLGERYRMILHGLWTYYVPPGDPAYGQLTAAPPHRDSLAPDPRVIAREMPSTINVWIPLTDVTPNDSCIYAVPAASDPDYYEAQRKVRPERFRLQDVRALPAAAGSVFGWSTHLVHWGSRSSRFAAAPRMSVTVYFQRRDVATPHPSATEFDAPIPFETRLALIMESLRVDGY